MRVYKSLLLQSNDSVLCQEVSLHINNIAIDWWQARLLGLIARVEYITKNVGHEVLENFNCIQDGAVPIHHPDLCSDNLMHVAKLC